MLGILTGASCIAVVVLLVLMGVSAFRIFGVGWAKYYNTWRGQDIPRGSVELWRGSVVILHNEGYLPASVRATTSWQFRCWFDREENLQKGRSTAVFIRQIDESFRFDPDITVFPAWLVIGILCVPMTGAWWLRRRLATRIRSGLCPSCGYDLRATPSRCPECGYVVPAAAMELATQPFPKAKT